MSRKVYNPANKNKVSEVIRFRGVIVDTNEQTVNNAYVGESSNLVSFRLREMKNRVGQQSKNTYDHGITAGQRTLSFVTICSGPNAYVDRVVGLGTVSGGDDFGNLTPDKEIDFIRPITGTNFTDMKPSVGPYAKFRNYHGSVFAHKRAVWGGMDQGKGQLYRGDYVEMMLNLRNKDNVLQPRDGSSKKISTDDPINAGKGTESGITIVIGTNAYFGEEFGDIAI